MCNTPYAAKTDMSLKQVDQYIEIAKPFITLGSVVTLTGGECTLHPDILKITDAIVKAFRPLMYSPIIIATNGRGLRSKEISKILQEKHGRQILIGATKASPDVRINHYPVYRSILDYPDELKAKGVSAESDFATKCLTRSSGGVDLTPYGVFMCCNASAIARLFHLDVGMTKVPSLEEGTRQQGIICKYCVDAASQFVPNTVFAVSTKPVPLNLDVSTPTWRKALESFDPSYSLTIAN